jgi:hypothetical protein
MDYVILHSAGMKDFWSKLGTGEQGNSDEEAVLTDRPNEQRNEKKLNPSRILLDQFNSFRFWILKAAESCSIMIVHMLRKELQGRIEG